MGKNFVLFSNCIPVKGVNRSIICDLQNNDYHIIPNGLYDILKEYNGKSINFIKKQFNNKYDSIVEEYFEFLLLNNLIFFHSEPDLFPEMDLKWKSASPITNAIIDYDKVFHDFDNIILQLENLKCSCIQIRIFRKIKIEFIIDVLKVIKYRKSRIVSIDFILPYNTDFSRNTFSSLLEEYPRIHAFIFFNSPNDERYDGIREKMGYLMYTKNNILDERHCGKINIEYFYSNVKLFSESLNHNTCLNRKIAIDKDGNIKNCPSMFQDFGNIKEVTLQKALEHKDFKKYWNVSKDQIAVCRDCEFRHICTDCRAYIEEPKNDYSKPLKCGYDPYKNEWENWSENPLKEKGIEYYNLRNLIK
jgi:SPASM domain peptide maturase of grasp-with-spasm system